MNLVPKVIELVVNNDLCIGCGICTYVCSNNTLEMKWNDFGFLIPAALGICKRDDSCISVCPFNPLPNNEVKTEKELAEIFLKDCTKLHPEIGMYHGLYAGYSKEFRLSSSSGGLATFIFTELLEKGVINNIFSVKESTRDGFHFEYSISTNKNEVQLSSKTKYYPVTLSSLFSKINELDGKVAIIGVACFIKAIRLLQYKNLLLREKIPFLIGIICGGFKSKFFTEYLSEKAGVKNELCYKPEYRIKDLNSTSDNYSFGCINKITNVMKTVKIQTVGDLWGSGLFKPNACDFCEDVTTELADVSLGDAWLHPYDKDGKGNNVIITRSELAENLIQDAKKSNKIYVEDLPINKLLSSQQGSINHRRVGLPFRIKQLRKKSQLIPPKRFGQGSVKYFDFNFVQLCRMHIRKKSLLVWKNTLNAKLFDSIMKKDMFILRKATNIYHYRQAIFSKYILNRLVRRINSYLYRISDKIR